jgi:hypothetical protein
MWQRSLRLLYASSCPCVQFFSAQLSSLHRVPLRAHTWYMVYPVSLVVFMISTDALQARSHLCSLILPVRIERRVSCVRTACRKHLKEEVELLFLRLETGVLLPGISGLSEVLIGSYTSEEFRPGSRGSLRYIGVQFGSQLRGCPFSSLPKEAPCGQKRSCRMETETGGI